MREHRSWQIWAHVLSCLALGFIDGEGERKLYAELASQLERPRLIIGDQLSAWNQDVLTLVVSRSEAPPAFTRSSV